MKNITFIAKNKKKSLIKAQNDVALQVLKHFSLGYPADRALSIALRERKFLGSRDRKFISENIFSLFRYWGWISQIHNTNCDFRKLLDKPEILSECLNTANYILENSDENSPDSITPKLSKFFQFPQEKLTIKNLFPEFFTKHISPKFNSEKILRIFQKRPPIWIRTKIGYKIKVEEALRKNNTIFESPKQFQNTIKVLNCSVSLYSLPEFTQGLFEIQDIASQTVGLIANPKPGEKWLDACAGAGGKSLQLADMMRGKGSIISQDPDEKKLLELKRRAKRGNFSNIRCKIADATKKNKKYENLFDAVLVDAPCSCSGTWRRNPDGRWRTEEKTITQFHQLQLEILNNSGRAVKKGGVLIYATCSVFKLENDDLVNEFLYQNKDFLLEDFTSPFDHKKTNGIFHADPSFFDSDAMFVAKFKKQS